MRTQQLSALLEQIYDAALDSALWPKVIDQIRIQVRGSGALLMTPLNPIDAGGLGVTANLDESFLSDYASRLQGEDLWIKTFAEKNLLRSGAVLTGEEVIPRKHLLTTRFYQEIQRPLDIGRLIVSVIFGLEAKNVQATSLSVFRRVGAPAFAQSAKDSLRLLLPHLSRSLGILYRLRNTEYQIATSLAALDQLSTGVALLDSTGGVLFANRVAFAILQQADGLSLRREAGKAPRISGANSAQTRSIEKAVCDALDFSQLPVSHFAHALSISRPTGAPPIVLNVSALPASNEFDTGSRSPRAIAFLTDTAATATVDPALLRNVYGIAKSEAQVVAALCAGGTLKAYAKSRGVSETTVKSQLQSVFRKTGVARQSELVRLMQSLAMGAADRHRK